MATESIHVSALIPASPEAIFDAWLSSEQHARMTGDVALIEPHVGGNHRAWGDYIWGKTLELEPGKRIVQSWRTLEFPKDSGDSRIVITLEQQGGHTRVEIAHTGIPEGQGARYQSGWHDHYFTPMVAHFESAGAAAETTKPGGAAKPAKRAAKKPAARKAAKKPTAKKAAKKPAAKKPAAKKAAKKPAARKPAAKKAATKMPARKPAAKKPARKPAAKKPAATKRPRP